jgi:hypothetical protein
MEAPSDVVEVENMAKNQIGTTIPSAALAQAGKNSEPHTPITKPNIQRREVKHHPRSENGEESQKRKTLLRTSSKKYSSDLVHDEEKGDDTEDGRLHAINTLISGKIVHSSTKQGGPVALSPSGKGSLPSLVGATAAEDKGDEEKGRQKKGDDVDQGPISQLFSLVSGFLGIGSQSTGPGPFSMDDQEPAPPVVTRKLVLVGTDDGAKQYLHRKLLCAPGDEFSGGQISRVGIRPAHKMSTSGCITVVEATDVPLEEIMEELDAESNRSYLMKHVIPKADAIIFMFDATDLIEILIDTEDGEEAIEEICPSFIDLQDMYDDLANIDVLSDIKVRLVVGNVGLHHELKASEMPRASMQAAQHWTEKHKHEGMHFLPLALGNDKDVRLIANHLRVDL